MVNKRYNELMNILMESVYSRRDEVVNRKEKEARRQKYAGKVSKYTRGEYPETYDEDDIRIRDLGKHSTYTGKVTFKSGYSKKSAPGSYNPKQVGSMRGVKKSGQKSSDSKSYPSSLMQNLAKSRQARAASRFKNESRQDEAKYESGQFPQVKYMVRDYRTGSLEGMRNRGRTHILKRGHKKNPQGFPETRPPASVGKETLEYNLAKSRLARAASKFKNESSHTKRK